MTIAEQPSLPRYDGDLTVAGAHRLLSSGQSSARELLERILDRCAALNDVLGAYTHLDIKGARAQSDALDHAGQRGGKLRALHGIPIAIKDMIDVAGMPTRAGSRILEMEPPAADDAPMVATLRDHGAVITGKTSTHEFAMGTVTPQARNPHQLERIAGGSSGGSAVAVSAGLALAALGTDTGGSIRIPAALCGVVGLKPRPGLLDQTGVIPLSPIADVAGPIAQTVTDARMIWGTLAPQAHHGAKVARVGIPPRSALGVLAPAVEEAYVQTQHMLRAQGIEVVTTQVPDFDDWYPVRLIPLYAAASRVHTARGWFPGQRDSYSAGLRSVLDTGAAQSTTEVLAAWAQLTALSGRLLEAMDACDAMLLPTTPITAPLRGRDVDGTEREGLTSVSQTLTRLCAPFNWVPVASATVPTSATDDGLPIGMQFVARDEMTALNAAFLVEPTPAGRAAREQKQDMK